MNNQILIVDDHPAVRMAVRLVLASEGFDIVAETDNGTDALRLIEVFGPSMLILDLGIPDIDGLTVIDTIVAQGLEVKIIVFTGWEPGHFASRCIQMGAHGFVNKRSNLHELVDAVRVVRANHCYFSNGLYATESRVSHKQEQQLLESLSPRELNVLQQLINGKNNKNIAKNMNLSVKTISTYKTRTLRKLNAHSLFDLMAFAKRHGLI
jgi:two-component system response regulator EvgA